MAGTGGGRQGEDSPGASAGRRKPRRRTILNLGIPFVPVDDAVNQAEDAVATGFDVLERVVDEIKAGYKIAQDYNDKQRRAAQAGEPRPAIPWLALVERGKNFQTVTLDAMRRGNEILLDSTRSSMDAALAFAEMLANARSDVDEKLPRLAGPIFDSLAMKAAPGAPSAKQSWSIRNRGLARLRIRAAAQALRYRRKTDADKTDARAVVVKDLKVKDVRFEPQGEDQETSVLTVEIDPIPHDQPPGTYEGSITAKNFELFIGQLIVEVTKSDSSRARPAPAPRSNRR